VAAGILAPFALLGGLVGRPIGDRLGSDGFALLTIALLTAAGLYTVAGAAVALLTRQPRTFQRGRQGSINDDAYS
jgi:uncharacterized membrane protein YfcA